MVKAYHLSALVAFSITTALGAWGQRAQTDSMSSAPDVRFPLSPEQSWAAEESLLVWKAYEDDTDYAVHRRVQTLTDSTRSGKQTIKHPEFDWSAGVRLKLTRYLPSNDPWDVNFVGTYYYADAKDHVKVHFDPFSSTSQNVLFSAWNSGLSGSAAKAKASTKMNFFTFDLTVGRYYSLTRRVDIHPFIGVRTALNYQDYRARYLSTVSFSPGFDFFTAKFKGEVDFWGVGPRVGTDVTLVMGRHWSLMGTFGASLFGGRYGVREKFHGMITGIPSFLNEKIKDRDTVLRSNIDLSLGLSWEKWVRNGTVRIAPSFVFEVSEWFSMKRWINSMANRRSLSDFSNPVLRTDRKYSDLGLMGFNINLKVDF